MSARTLIEAATPGMLHITFQGQKFPLELTRATHRNILNELVRRFGANDEESFVARFSKARIGLDAGPGDTNAFTVSELVDWVRAVERNKR